MSHFAVGLSLETEQMQHIAHLETRLMYGFSAYRIPNVQQALVCR
jgi:hypothetical protein